MTVLAPPRPPVVAEERRGLSAPERRTRRRFVVRWVSIGVGLLLVAATPIVTSILASHALQEASAPPSLAEVSRLGQTQMTPAGIAYAQLHSQASFNLLHLPQPASELGMQENATVVLEPSAGGIQTTVVGPAGGVEAWASSITATTERGDWVRLEVTEDALGFGDFTRLMQRVDVLAQMLDWRWSDRLADAAASAVAEGVRTGETTLVQVDGSDAFGMTTSGRIECTAEGACTLTTVFEVG
ncbi:hypothetical protein [Agrococcus jejuensis]|uniref:hypothetical protein n=1 Tax=Agrococcus jejuensis TaxID=399736 RepID=UPI0011AAAD5C|nr:hypothetical protein [Agrococcus jejuensis]